MASSAIALIDRPLVKHILFWVCAGALLTLIYGTAYGHYGLGLLVILMLLPVHMGYFYVMVRWILPRFLLTGKYIPAVAATLAIMFLVVIAYRLAEIFIVNPFIFDFYQQRNFKITWPEINLPWWQQFMLSTDFVNALERSNVVVWIGISLKFVSLWFERRQAALRAELDALKAQLHPHFLFNSLNNVYAFALDNSPRTPETILRISSILRYVLYEGSAANVSLKKEIEVLQSYIELEKIRYEERLELNLNVRGTVNSQEIAPLLMLPLIENAFKHGASETIGTPWINIDLLLNGSDFTFKVSNSKPDTQSSALKPSGTHIGLANVRKRLQLLYPGRHSFRVHDEEDVFVVELKLTLS
ncbi:histidine kinase [Chryseolinea sp. T2]|uniref:sensor histidine kinase n=1 Tax=Chryseolinea sp. T2 TaxID=3129255 RepID=UPI0030788124